MVGISPNGKMYGIELLNADEQLKEEDMGKLLVIYEETGEQRELSLP